ncbi:zinc uptake protein ZrgA [Vibrio tritonius]|uniref:zinc uptake protein ZrgA n=1 Tax=Vibrio tritonius TaxID=1435069 RepID=UPI0008398798|nr:DUF2796 domain-containing protein [Vibrio tritonius]
MFTKSLIAITLSSTLAATAFAQEEFRQHEAHVHGHVEMNIAQDGHDLLIEIDAPGVDVVGFEHTPQSDNDKATMKKALALLNDPTQLFSLSSSAKCHIEDVLVSNTVEGHDEEAHEHDHHHDDADEHHHDDEHHRDDADEHEHHHADEHEHEHEHHEGDEHEHEGEHHHEHGAFNIQYQFHCDEIDQLTQLESHWFTHFHNTKELDVNLLTDKQQTALELSPGHSTISL